MERDFPNNKGPKTIDDFNSHAHVERDDIVAPSDLIFAISTHTLTWSVTLTKEPFSGHFQISTHTLTWSVT